MEAHGNVSEKNADPAAIGIKSKYRKMLVKRLAFIAACIILIVLVAGVSATLGSYKISFLDVYSSLWDKIINGKDTVASNVVWQLRLPRIFLAILAGIGLAGAGVVMQSILRNPLADPYVLGISSGASMGAAIAIVMGASIAGGAYLIVGNAFVFSLIPTFLIFMLTFKRRAAPETLILAGVAIAAIFSSVTSIILYFTTAEALNHVFFWMFGSVDIATWGIVVIVAVLLMAFYIPIIWKAKDLNVIASGEEVAKSLGINVDRTRIVMLGIASLMTSAIVAFTGPIGFIGLVSPHVCRMVIGGDNRLLIPASAVAGALILVTSDTIARTIIAPIVLPIGVVANIIGAPVLIYLIMRRRKEFW